VVMTVLSKKYNSNPWPRQILPSHKVYGWV
jgi:hypothetical protein